MPTAPQQPKKLIIGWFSFSCCEDSTIMFTELLNDHFTEWTKLLEFKHARVLQNHNVLGDMDVAFIEGAVTSDEEEKLVKQIRALAKKVVTIGSCATMGLPSGQRNQFDADTQASIQFLLDRFGQSKKVRSIPEVIEVDAKVPGCPMDEKKILEVVNGYLNEFKII
jgi:coenzyme F420-reducing hydrogenase gamma subunit